MSDCLYKRKSFIVLSTRDIDLFFADNAMLAVGCEDGHIHIFYVHDEGQIYRKNNIILRVSTYKLYSYIELLRSIGSLPYLAYNFCCIAILRDT